ncbi:methyltransferase [Frankia sp. Cr1]|uniref:methyltransferase n=1 Tax=Frankia sp. Cr1 TaxID=3073931 RepID=UPI003A100401
MTQGAVRPTQIPVHGQIYGLVSGAWVAQMINAVAELGIADALSDDKPVPADELAVATGVDPDKLHRILRALTAFGVFAADTEGRYVHTDLSRVLRRDHPTSMRNAVLTACADWQWQSWSRLTDSVRSGRSAFDDVFGKDMWSYFAEDDPGAETVFQEAHSELATMTDRPLAAAVDIADAVTVVDIGGGYGDFLAAVVDRHPHLNGVLFDTPGTLRSLASDTAAARRAERFTLQPGDFCETVDCSADIYLLKLIICSFDDDMGVRILRNCAANAKPGARIVVIDRVVTNGPDSVQAKLSDVQMFVLHPDGRVRTEREFADLFEKAGLGAPHFTPTPSGIYLIEATMHGEAARS